MNAKKRHDDETKTNLYGSTFSAESIKVMAEMSGHNLSDDAAKELAEDVSDQVKKLLQDAVKFMHHSRCTKLTTSHVDSAMRARGFEPTYGYLSKDFVPFRFASGGGRELHFNEETEVDLSEYLQIAANNVKVPLGVNVRAHWLVVDGIQPLIPENPPPLTREAQILEAVNPVLALDQAVTKESAGKPAIGKKHKWRNAETVHVKQLATHELSVEQQVYYKEITEACVGSDESRRGEALASLAMDAGLYEMLPRMCTFIAEGVKVNVVQNNLALLIYLMRMVKALLDNPTLYLEKYLHEIIPSVITCIVSKQLCMRPELDNHWALRDFAARLMSQICKNFNTTTNNLQTRVTRIFSKALFMENYPLSSLYGSLAALAELGGEVVRALVIPRVKFISERIEVHLVSSSATNTDKTAAGHIRAMIQKTCPPIIRQIRNPPDYMEDYKHEYGFLGSSLCQAVVKLRNGQSGPMTSHMSSFTNGTITSAAQTATGRPRPTTTTSQPSNSKDLSTLTKVIQNHQLRQQQILVQDMAVKHASPSPSVGSPLTLQSGHIITSRPTSISPVADMSPRISPRTVISPQNLNPMSPGQMIECPPQKGFVTKLLGSSSTSPALIRPTGSSPTPTRFIQSIRTQGSRMIPSPSATQTMSPVWSTTISPTEQMQASPGPSAQPVVTQTYYQEPEATYQGMRIVQSNDNIILDEGSEVPPPPELDDLSHLE